MGPISEVLPHVRSCQFSVLQVLKLRNSRSGNTTDKVQGKSRPLQQSSTARHSFHSMQRILELHEVVSVHQMLKRLLEMQAVLSAEMSSPKKKNSCCANAYTTGMDDNEWACRDSSTTCICNRIADCIQHKTERIMFTRNLFEGFKVQIWYLQGRLCLLTRNDCRSKILRSFAKITHCCGGVKTKKSIQKYKMLSYNIWEYLRLRSAVGGGFTHHKMVWCMRCHNLLPKYVKFSARQC
ncbi:hypothetical protein PR048_013942 [Dryococelus australis]|uniref:Uncharacterized protein n=1 Tax=Dryococelus australis TaxID=614101 RepID=A0ABQ9HUI5_9NEOP|nr:hypothetical protein PR048_013942 [Dryococelus australis]